MCVEVPTEEEALDRIHGEMQEGVELRLVVDDVVVEVDHGQGQKGGGEGEGESHCEVLVDHGVGDHHEGASDGAADKGGHPRVFGGMGGGVEGIPLGVGNGAGNGNPIGVCIRTARDKRPPVGLLDKEDIGGGGCEESSEGGQATANIHWQEEEAVRH
jgi:hypothetical protein